MRSTKKGLVDGYADWIGQHEWNWFGTLTFKYRPGRRSADNALKKWLAELKKSESGPSFRWVRVKELGAFKDNLHFHILVGGLRSSASIVDWEDRWLDLAGDARICEFEDDKGGVRYLLKTLLPDEDFDFEIELPKKMVDSDAS